MKQKHIKFKIGKTKEIITTCYNLFG